MMESSEPFQILIADDDEDDRLLIQMAFRDVNLPAHVRFVEDGEQLLDYLLRQGDFSDPGASPRPCLILLDLNMPRKDGREALREIKAHPDLSPIPIIVLTTSTGQDDIRRSYQTGANSYITKPSSFEALVEIMRILGQYWMKIVKVPC